VHVRASAVLLLGPRRLRLRLRQQHDFARAAVLRRPLLRLGLRLRQQHEFARTAALRFRLGLRQQHECACEHQQFYDLVYNNFVDYDFVYDYANQQDLPART
jgi:hypothetical protein